MKGVKNDKFQIIRMPFPKQKLNKKKTNAFLYNSILVLVYCYKSKEVLLHSETD